MVGGWNALYRMHDERMRDKRAYDKRISDERIGDKRSGAGTRDRCDPDSRHRPCGCQPTVTSEAVATLEGSSPTATSNLGHLHHALP